MLATRHLAYLTVERNPDKRIALFMVNTIAEAFAPASMGNVGIGFDVLGLAYESPGDRVTAEFDDQVTGAYLVSIEGDGGRLSLKADENCAAVAANALLKQLGETRGIKLTLKKGLPLASGLGSSAASSVAAAFAVNALLGEPVSRIELLPACLEGEAAVSGYHADNVAPALLGGITLITGTRPDQIFSLPVPDNLYFALITPDVAVPTAQARAVLPAQVPLKTLITQTAGVGEFIDALYRGDLARAAAAMERDVVVEPARAALMPRLAEARAAAKAAGALSLVISGAGPTLAAVCDRIETAQQVAGAMQGVYDEIGLDSRLHTTGVSKDGASLVALL
jgi:homoserine kinase